MRKCVGVSMYEYVCWIRGVCGGGGGGDGVGVGVCVPNNAQQG